MKLTCSTALNETRDKITEMIHLNERVRLRPLKHPGKYVAKYMKE
jgi:hypothetical protein